MMRRVIIVLVIYSVITAIMTFPLVLNINTYIPGFSSTDEPYAAIWDSWRVRFSFYHKLPLGYTRILAYPFGLNIYAGYDAYLWRYLMYLFTIATSPIFTYNVQIFYNFVLRGLFTYLLVLFITRNDYSAFVSGLIFAFSPFQFVRSWQHIGLTYNEWLPLCLFALLLLKEKIDSGTMPKLIFLTSLLLLFSFDYTVTYIGVVSLIAVVFYSLIHNLKKKISIGKKWLRNDLHFLCVLFIIGIIAFLILLPQLLDIMMPTPYLNAQASRFNPYKRPFDDLFVQSAKPLSYFLPHTTHPLFGSFTERFMGSPLYGISYTEHTLYLGWVPIFLSFLAIAYKRKIRHLKSESPKENNVFYIGLFCFLAFTGWVFSQPPYFTFPYFRIYMPSYFLYKVMPMFRAYCRFGILVILSVSVLSGFGIKYLLDGFKSRKIKAFILTIIVSLVIFEFMNFPPFKVIDLQRYPKVYNWLKSQPGDFVIAEYPLDFESPNEYYKFCQTIHQKKLINGTIPGTFPNKVAYLMRKLSSPTTILLLRWMRVKYVLVHLETYRESNDLEIIKEYERLKSRSIEGLKFLNSFDNVDVYEVLS